MPRSSNRRFVDRRRPIALVVFLRGVNVGGNRVFRPAALPAKLPELDLVNIGAAGTFVVRRRVPRAGLRDALRRQLPFEAEIVICGGNQVLRLLAADHFAAQGLRDTDVRFVSVLGARPRVEPLLPMELRDGRRWLVKLIGRRDCFVVGAYRRALKTIGYLGRIDKLFDVPITTRNWNTMQAVGRLLEPRGPA